LNTYDYIIAGAGAAGLSLAVRLSEHPFLCKKKILILDSNFQKEDDRTWSFWEKSPDIFEPIVKKQWDTLEFHSPVHDTEFSISPYSYKLIRGIDFYNYCLNKISQNPNITTLQCDISKIKDNVVTTSSGEYYAKYIFNSALFDIQPKEKDHYVLQHFMGWYLKTENECFDPGVANIMDFRVHQNYGCTFIYVLPFSSTEALVEYTLFTPELLKKDTYREELQRYMEEFFPDESFEIESEEFGIIPMTNFKFDLQNGSHIINLGTAGGHTKACTGYTFKNIQKITEAIVNNLAEDLPPTNQLESPKKYNLYDSTLLNIISKNNYPVWKAFQDLWTKNKPEMLLSFLDEETNIFEDIKIMSSVDTIPFLRAAIKELTILNSNE